ncbi:STAS domain-containing protein [Actinomadura verrucosospora]
MLLLGWILGRFALSAVNPKNLLLVIAAAARPDFVTAVAAMLGVMIFDTLPGLFIGIGVSLLLLLYRSSRPVISELGRLPEDGHFAALDRHTDGRRIPGVVVLRVEAGIYFANAERIRSTVRSAAGREGATAVVIDAAAGDVGQVRDVLRTAGARAELRHVYPTVQAAVDASSTGT